MNLAAFKVDFWSISNEQKRGTPGERGWVPRGTLLQIGGRFNESCCYEKVDFWIYGQ